MKGIAIGPAIYETSKKAIFQTGLQKSPGIKILFLMENIVLSNSANVISELLVKH